MNNVYFDYSAKTLSSGAWACIIDFPHGTETFGGVLQGEVSEKAALSQTLNVLNALGIASATLYTDCQNTARSQKGNLPRQLNLVWIPREDPRHRRAHDQAVVIRDRVESLRQIVMVNHIEQSEHYKHHLNIQEEPTPKTEQVQKHPPITDQQGKKEHKAAEPEQPTKEESSATVIKKTTPKRTATEVQPIKSEWLQGGLQLHEVAPQKTTSEPVQKTTQSVQQQEKRGLALLQLTLDMEQTNIKASVMEEKQQPEKHEIVVTREEGRLNLHMWDKRGFKRVKHHIKRDDKEQEKITACLKEGGVEKDKAEQVKILIQRFLLDKAQTMVINLLYLPKNTEKTVPKPA